MKKSVPCAAAAAGILMAVGLLTSIPSATAATGAIPAPDSIYNLNWLDHVHQRGNPPSVDTGVQHRQITVRDDAQIHPRGRH